MKNFPRNCVVCLFLVIIFLQVFNTEQVGFCSDNLELGTLQVSGEELTFRDQNILITGNIAVKDNASLTFHDCNVTQLWVLGGDNPHIMVSGNGRLTLDNSTMYIRLDNIPNYSTNGRITVQDQGWLVVNSSKILCTDNVIMRVHGNCHVIFNHSKYAGRARDSTLHWAVEDLLPHWVIREYFDDYALYAGGNTMVSIVDSEFGELSVSDNVTCNIEGSKVSELFPGSLIQTQCHDSEITILSTSQWESGFTFTGSAEGHYDEAVLRDILGPNISGNLALYDSSFEHLWLSLVNCSSEIVDAELWLLYISGGETEVWDSDIEICNLYYGDVLVEDSRIEYLLGNCRDGFLEASGVNSSWLSLTGHNRYGDDVIDAVVSGSRIDECKVNYMSIVQRADVRFMDTVFYNLSMKAAPSFNIVLDGCTVTDTLTLTSLMDAPFINLSGEVEFLEEGLQVYHGTVLNREYVVRLLDDGEPVAYARVELLNDSDPVWSGVTDSLGSVYFNVSWINDAELGPVDMYGIGDSLALQYRDHVEVVSILTDTPIIIKLNEINESRFPPVTVLLGVVLVIVLFYAVRRLQSSLNR